ncbi:hypothetical protein [Amycolatopsis sp. cmx-11-51]|uniref:hypothetical protein n=1 Tax=Amycolatopsis sp. cmx-11-51 TaxID=2785797 RepID=UPI0039E51B9E
MAAAAVCRLRGGIQFTPFRFVGVGHGDAEEFRGNVAVEVLVPDDDETGGGEEGVFVVLAFEADAEPVLAFGRELYPFQLAGGAFAEAAVQRVELGGCVVLFVARVLDAGERVGSGSAVSRGSMSSLDFIPDVDGDI